MKCTLKVNMILEHGQAYPRGTVLDREMIPAHLRKPDYIADGIANVDVISPIDAIEIEDTEAEEQGQVSPMQELILPEIMEEAEVKSIVSRKPLLKKRKAA
jgi:hypothetical protein